MLYYEEDWIAVNLRHSDPSNMGSLFMWDSLYSK